MKEHVFRQLVQRVARRLLVAATGQRVERLKQKPLRRAVYRRLVFAVVLFVYKDARRVQPFFRFATWPQHVVTFQFFYPLLQLGENHKFCPFMPPKRLNQFLLPPFPLVGYPFHKVTKHEPFYFAP